ncbi:competence pheromone ComX [Sporosarcina sp. HYO08]|uniref:competence pheromone ComX n=1 Tax=Sporosarcina sp. HYO08 TaxID=1759557 RepID=UPI0009EC7144|nr:competence pheromone ComX [Sporosarcina sp. HYO08]
MQEVIQFLVQNSDVLNKIKEGQACLIGVSAEELTAILDVFLDAAVVQPAYYWA